MKYRCNLLDWMWRRMMVIMSVGSLFVSCSEGEATEIDREGTQALQVVSARMDSELLTRSTTLVTSGSIGLFLRNLPGYDVYTEKSNVQYNYGTPSWTVNAGATPIYLGGDNANVCAYYPYLAGNNDVSIAMQSRGYDANYDLSYATNVMMNGTSETSDPVAGTVGCKVSFTMKRAYAMLAFEFVRSNYPGTCKITAIEIQKCVQSGSINISNGNPGNSVLASGTNFTYLTKPAEAITVPLDKSYITGKDVAHLYENCLIVPGDNRKAAGSDTGGFLVVLTVDNHTMTAQVPYSALPKFEAGKIYTVRLSLKGTATEIGTVTIEDWVAGPSTGGPYEPLP